MNEFIVKAENFELLSEGEHALGLVTIQDLGNVAGQFGVKHKVRFVWMSNEVDLKGRPFLVVQSMTLSFHEKSSLRKVVKQILGYEPGVDSFDLNTLLGAQRRCVVEHSEGSGRTFANISAILKGDSGVVIKPPKGWVPPAVKSAMGATTKLNAKQPPKAHIPSNTDASEDSFDASEFDSEQASAEVEI